jgi:hypothetical protein
VQRNWIVFADRLERAVRRTAGAHVIFGMDFEEATGLRATEDGWQMFWLETRSRKPFNGMERKAKTDRA